METSENPQEPHRSRVSVRAAGIPVVTLVTDIPDSARLTYVGMDNRAAGATGAYD